MKKIIFLLTLVALAGCKQPVKQNSGAIANSDAGKPMDTLQSIIDANIDKQPVIDTVFVGFAFNMTKKQVMDHYHQLIKDKRLVKDTDGKLFEYPLSFSMVQAKAKMGPEFHGDKMYKFNLMITPADDAATPETVFFQAATAYMKKYDGNGFTLYQDTDPVDPSIKRFHWIKNNLHIFLYKEDGATFVSYINMPVAKQADKGKQNASDSSKVQTNKDI
ncbi:MAG TPA: hypothetical protein VFE53_07155 [Mucilaginibacter sp.]|jgi:hypothetical protein|nr:hypothetical protein [Mucilaginibacter sp.]